MASLELLMLLPVLVPISFGMLLVDGSTMEPLSFLARLCRAGDWKPPTSLSSPELSLERGMLSLKKPLVFAPNAGVSTSFFFYRAFYRTCSPSVLLATTLSRDWFREREVP